MNRLLMILFLAVAIAVIAGGAIVQSASLLAAGVALVIGLAMGLALRRQRRATDHEKDSFAPEELPSRLLDVALNEMREGLLVIDTDMRIVASNHAARGLFSTADAKRTRLTELTRNPAIYDAFLDAVQGKERAGVRVETYGNGNRVFDLRVVPLRSAGNGKIAGAVGVFFDISQLERLEIVRQEFLANVSHELRTPLTSILASAETLESSETNNVDSKRRFLGIIHKNAARMQRLINDLLELSAIENIKVDVERVPLYPLIEDVASSLSVVALERKVTIRNSVATDANVFADPHRLMQMLTNLIDNAIKFNREGGTITINHEGGATDLITVTDTGEGIPPQHLDRLFERFYRVDRARSRNLGGTGLGLAIVKHLAKAHGGDVSVSSRLGEGSQFKLQLPRHNKN